jgi:hypothetical protein
MSTLTRLLRRRGTPDRPSGGWACLSCGLTAGPFDDDEASLLARLHEEMMSHPAGTTVRLAG